MIEEIQKNIDLQFGMLREVSIYMNRLEESGQGEKGMLESTISSLKESIRIISQNMPEMIQKVSITQPLTILKSGEFEKFSINFRGKDELVTLNKNNKKKLMGELRISHEIMKKIGRDKNIITKVDNQAEFRAYYKWSNRLFANTARNAIAKGYFEDLRTNLKKSNMNLLLEGYVSMIFTTSFFIFILSLLIFAYFLFFNFGMSSPFVSMHTESILTRIIKIFWIPVILPLGTFLFLYWYPGGEKNTIEKRIDQELPFAVVHMSAIAGSGVEPVAIFKIIAVGNEYPYLKKEIRKTLNQINLYGYDLVTSLNNSAKNSPSKKLAELFTGMAITITSGGELSNFFEKRSESLINEYRLSREKYTKVAETSMDLYITVVIAAPMVLLLVFILLSINPELGVSISPQLMTIILILAISLVNVIFLTILHIKQPSY